MLNAAKFTLKILPGPHLCLLSLLSVFQEENKLLYSMFLPLFRHPGKATQPIAKTFHSSIRVLSWKAAMGEPPNTVAFG